MPECPLACQGDDRSSLEADLRQGGGKLKMPRPPEADRGELHLIVSALFKVLPDIMEIQPFQLFL